MKKFHMVETQTRHCLEHKIQTVVLFTVAGIKFDLSLLGNCSTEMLTMFLFKKYI